MNNIGLIVIGCSAGGIEALKYILSKIDSLSLPPIVIVQHRGAEGPAIMIPFFKEVCRLSVKDAESKEPLALGHVYFAPAGYHLLVSDQLTFDLTVEDPVNYSRPSIDVLFESVASIAGLKTLGIVLTGANEDGAKGLKKIVDHGGLAVVQDPEEALFIQMPQAALRLVPNARKFRLQEIVGFLLEMSKS